MAGLLDLVRMTQGQTGPGGSTATPPFVPSAPTSPTEGLLAAYLEWMKRQQEEQQKIVEGTPKGMDAADALTPPPKFAATAPSLPAPATQQKSGGGGGGLLSLFKLFF